MAITVATNFKNNSNLPLDADSVFDSMPYLLASPWRKEGTLVYVKDEKSYYFWDGAQYVKQGGGASSGTTWLVD